MLLSARREGLAAHLREWALALRPSPWPKAALKAAPERAQSSLRRGRLFSRVGIWPLRGPWLSNSVTLRGDGGRSRGLLFPGAWREKDIGSFRHRRSLGGFEWGPAQLGKCIAFLLPGIGRACARVDQLRSPFLDGAAPNDRRIPDRPGLRARKGRKSLAQARRS